jgi:nitroreductase/NAD-dependent dihydropyrimidine dehydrogenase PreA subunit
MENYIDSETCTQCFHCIEICPGKLIAKDENNKVYFNPGKNHLCLVCGQCMAICNAQSVHIKSLSYKDNMIKLNPNNIDFTNFYNFLISRRSVRNFGKKPVEKKLIENILEAIYQAPFGAIQNSVDITVITDKNVIDKALPLMSSFYSKIENWITNPFMRWMIKRNAGIERFNTIKKHLLPRIKTGHYELKDGQDHITRNAPVIIIFHAPKESEEHTCDSLIFLTYGLLAAHAQGLGATVIGLIPPAINKVTELKFLFQIPEKNEAVASLILGYPKFQYKRGIKRNRGNEYWIEPTQNISSKE